MRCRQYNVVPRYLITKTHCEYVSLKYHVRFFDLVTLRADIATYLNLEENGLVTGVMLALIRANTEPEMLVQLYTAWSYQY